jgi:alpha-L-rhamnosidase
MESTRREFIAAGSAVAAAAGAAATSPAGSGAERVHNVEEATALVQTADAARWHPWKLNLAPANWIWMPCQRVLPNTFVLFRKQFTLASVPPSAVAWIAADSRYRLTVNGQRVQAGPAPCDPRALDADPVDLAPFLRAGENSLGVEVLFYGTGDGAWAAGKPGLLFHLQLPGGPVLSDATWLCFLDRAHRPGMHKRWFLRALQEEFDARLHPGHWDEPSFTPNAEWLPALVLNCPADKPVACGRLPYWSGDTIDTADRAKSSLRMRQIPANAEALSPALRLAHSGRIHWLRNPDDWFEMRIPGSFRIERDPVAREIAPGEWELPATENGWGCHATFEFHEQVTGWPYFTIDAPAGTVVELMPQEAHDPAATAWLDTHHFSWSRFICREGENRMEAFDTESLRWFQLHVRNSARAMRLRGVGVRRKRYAWPHTPAIRCSEPALQRLFDAGINTLHGSAIETVVDGGGRERQQYSGDGGHQLHAIRYAFGETRICRRFLRTFSEGLTPEGYFMDSWPAYDRLARVAQKQIDGAYWGPLLDHGVGFVFDCWHHYFQTAEKEALEEPYPRLAKFGEYLAKRIGGDGLLQVENLGVPTVWIDHEAFKLPRHKQCAFNLYSAAMFRHALAPLAELFGEPGRAARCRRVADGLLAATQRRFWSPRHGLFVDNLPWLEDEKALRLSDRTLATSVLFDQCPAANTKAAVRALAEAPPEMGLSYPCNAGWRYWALGKAGRAEVVVADFRRRWATMEAVRLNNTLPEFWTARPDTTQEWSHCPLAPIYNLYMDVAGIQPLEPGFARCQIRPQLADLPDLELTAWTVKGPIEFRAHRVTGGHRVEVSVPPGCEATIVTADGQPLGHASAAQPAGVTVPSRT